MRQRRLPVLQFPLMVEIQRDIWWRPNDETSACGRFLSTISTRFKAI
jgi:hypothetical protein